MIKWDTKLLSFPFFITGISTLIKCITCGYGPLYYATYPGLLFAFSAVLFFSKIKINKNIMGNMMLIFSILATIKTEPTSLNSVFFLTYAFLFGVNKKWLKYIYLPIVTASTIIVYSITPYKSSDVFLHLAGISFVLVLYKILSYKKPATLADIKGLNDIDVQIIVLIARGYGSKEIPDKLILEDPLEDPPSPAAIRQRQRRICAKFGVATNSQLIYHLFKNNLWNEIE